MIERTERPLTGAERQDLLTRLERARRETRTALTKTGTASALVCGILLAITLLASDAPWWVVSSFWALIALVFTLWIGMPWRRLMRNQVSMLEDGLRTAVARVTRVRSDRVVEFEEEEDEGACYAFALDANASLFIVGQEFYEDDDFPNSDFSIVEILGPRGNALDMIVQKHGQKLMRERVIPAAVKWRLAVPEHMTVVNRSVDTIEDALRHRASNIQADKQ
jgi:hypothetical protein